MSTPPPEASSGFPVLAPAIGIQDARSAMGWYRRVFDAKEVLCLTGPDGSIVHGELEIEGCLLMLGEESPEWGNHAPPSLGGTPVRLHLYVSDVDEVVRRAEQAGAEVLIPVADQFYGDRAGRFRDPYGHEWIIASRVKQMSEAEMQSGLDQLFEG